MQHINDNMDELFKNAAKEYPLRTDSSDWEAVNKKLSIKDTAEEKVQQISLRKFLQLSTVLSLFMIVPLSISNYLMNYNGSSKYNNRLAQVDESEPFHTIKPAAENHLEKFSNAIDNARHKLPSDDNIVNTNSVTDFYSNNINETGLEDNAPIQNKINSLSLPPVLQKQTIATIQNDVKQLNEKSIAQQNVQTASELNKKELKKLNAQKNIYAGFIGAGELTNVHGQAFRKPGFNGGFVLGYNLNKRVQAEVGLLASRKYYYSDGKYASPNSLRDDGVAIGGVKIFSSMAEIPVLLRYNITNTNTSKLFISGGGVANFVHEEHYNYKYQKDGRDRKAGKVYDDSIDNLFSNIQLSAGYEHTLGNAGYMRIEPYYRLPINGTGAANFHVTSMGVNLGFIKYFR